MLAGPDRPLAPAALYAVQTPKQAKRAESSIRRYGMAQQPPGEQQSKSGTGAMQGDCLITPGLLRTMHPRALPAELLPDLAAFVPDVFS